MTAQAEANRSRLRGDGDAAAKHQGRADQYEQQADDQLQQTPLVEIALGEVGPTARLDIRDTLTTPDAAALDANEHRIDLRAAAGVGAGGRSTQAARSAVPSGGPVWVAGARASGPTDRRHGPCSEVLRRQPNHRDVRLKLAPLLGSVIKTTGNQSNQV